MINILQTKEFYEAKIDTKFIYSYYRDGYNGKTIELNKLEIMARTALYNNLKYIKEINDEYNKKSKKRRSSFDMNGTHHHYNS
mgnify:CR=1 FL=1